MPRALRTVYRRHYASAARVLCLQGRRQARLRPRPQGQAARVASQAAAHRQHRTQRCDLDNSEIDLRICCSKGTYIRALARDIGIALRSGAHLTALRRTRVGEADISRCFATIDDFEQWLGGIEVETELPANPEERAPIGIYPE